MARTSNKDKAIAYAAEHGIILTVDHRDIFDGDYAVEVWSFDSHLSKTNSYYHTYLARGNTEARVWADVLVYMRRLAECPADCFCRDQDDIDQDQDQDQNRDQDQVRCPSRAMSALDTLRTFRHHQCSVWCRRRPAGHAQRYPRNQLETLTTIERN